MKWLHESDVDISDLLQLKNFCVNFAKRLKGDEVLLLNGPMAVGKSEFVRQMVSVILKEEVSSSPSYALQHQYAGVSHWDLFRLENKDDLESTGFWDQLQNSQELTFIEWAEKLNQEWLPKERKYYLLQFHRHQSKITLNISRSF